MWPKRLRGIKWKFSLINLIQLNFHHKINTIKKKKKFFFFKLKNFNFLNFTCKFIKFYYFKFYYLFFKKKKIFKIKNKLFKYNINNLFNKIFNPFKFNIYIKTKLNTKKLNFLKFFFFNIYKNNFFKNFNFVKKQYFLSFLYTIWSHSQYSCGSLQMPPTYSAETPPYTENPRSNFSNHPEPPSYRPHAFVPLHLATPKHQ